VKRNWQLWIFCAIHALILLVLFRSNLYHNASLQHDISVFFNYSSQTVSGLLPYRDFTVEYPPLALVFFTLPRLVASSLSSYQIAFAVEILIFDLLGLFLLSKLSRRLGLQPAVTLAISTVLLLAIGPILIYRYDIIPAVLVLASLYAFSQQKYRLSWAILAAAVMTKLYPAVIAPILLLCLLSHRRYREAGWGIAVFAVTAAVITIPGLLISPGGFWDSFSLQMQRGLHADSTYASFLLLGETLGLTKVSIQIVGPTPLSVDAVSPFATTLVKIAPFIMIPTLCLIYWLFYRRSRSSVDLPSSLNPPAIADLINYSFLAILIFLLTSHVFSPQFLIWLFPIVPLVTLRRRHLPWLLLSLAAILTYYLYPLHYSSFRQEDPQMIYILLSRNILLIALAVFSIVWRQPAPAYPEPRLKRISLKSYAFALTLVIAVSTILFFQFSANSNILPGEANSEMPGDQLPGGRSGDFQHDGLPSLPRDNQPNNSGNR